MAPAATPAVMAGVGGQHVSFPLAKHTKVNRTYQGVAYCATTVAAEDTDLE